MPPLAFLGVRRAASENLPVGWDHCPVQIARDNGPKLQRVGKFSSAARLKALTRSKATPTTGKPWSYTPIYARANSLVEARGVDTPNLCTLFYRDLYPHSWNCRLPTDSYT